MVNRLARDERRFSLLRATRGRSRGWGSRSSWASGTTRSRRSAWARAARPWPTWTRRLLGASRSSGGSRARCAGCAGCRTSRGARSSRHDRNRAPDRRRRRRSALSTRAGQLRHRRRQWNSRSRRRRCRGGARYRNVRARGSRNSRAGRRGPRGGRPRHGRPRGSRCGGRRRTRFRLGGCGRRSRRGGRFRGRDRCCFRGGCCRRGRSRSWGGADGRLERRAQPADGRLDRGPYAAGADTNIRTRGRPLLRGSGRSGAGGSRARTFAGRQIQLRQGRGLFLRSAVLQPLSNAVRDGVIQRTGVGLLLGYADLRQDLNNGACLNFQLPRQFVDSNLICACQDACAPPPVVLVTSRFFLGCGWRRIRQAGVLDVRLRCFCAGSRRCTVVCSIEYCSVDRFLFRDVL